MFKLRKPRSNEVLPDRDQEIPVADQHFVNGNPIKGPFPSKMAETVVGMGCFWGAERMFWQLEGVFCTSVGYSGGSTRNPSYQDVCSGRTGHVEVVKVVWDPDVIPFSQILKTFWEGHDPTQGMRQGNDVGTQYRSAIYTFNDEQQEIAGASRDHFQSVLKAAGYGSITTEIAPATEYFYAEDYHQQYLAKVPNGYCGLGGTGLACNIGN